SSGNAGAPGQVLTSQGPNASPAWNTLENQGYVKGVFYSNDNSNNYYTGTLNGAGYTTINYNNISKIDNSVIAYSNGTFTAKKNGFYTIHSSIAMQFNGQIAKGAAVLAIMSNNNLMSATHSVHEGQFTMTTYGVSVSSSAYLTAGQTFYVTHVDHLNHNVIGRNITIIYTQ
ncbi:hypothetical protein SAMN05880574_1621, partial [Chryseobacterium sp. RU37D]|uniref:hypothetical protein n=1 Tax=Chryseobacterium sp. RU37D TaxID=1907397 RepID=UPI0009568ACA